MLNPVTHQFSQVLPISPIFGKAVTLPTKRRSDDSCWVRPTRSETPAISRDKCSKFWFTSFCMCQVEKAYGIASNKMCDRYDIYIYKYNA